MKKEKTKKPQFDLDAIMRDKTKRDQLQGFVDEAVLCKRKIATENESIKDIREEAVQSMGVPPKMFNKLVKTVFKDDFEQEKKEFEDFEAVVEAMKG